MAAEIARRVGEVRGAAEDLRAARRLSGAAVRFRARLSSPRAWAVAVTTPTRVEVARGSGTGADVDWTWDSAGVAAGSFSWSIGTSGARSATGVAARRRCHSAARDRSRLGRSRGDQPERGRAGRHRASHVPSERIRERHGRGRRLDRRRDLHARRSRLEGSRAAHVDDRRRRPARRALRNRDHGSHRFRRQVQSTVPLNVSRTLGLVTATPVAFSPNGDGKKDVLAMTFALTAPADVRIRVERDGRWVASPLTASFLPGTTALRVGRRAQHRTSPGRSLRGDRRGRRRGVAASRMAFHSSPTPCLRACGSCPGRGCGSTQRALCAHSWYQRPGATTRGEACRGGSRSVERDCYEGPRRRLGRGREFEQPGRSPCAVGFARDRASRLLPCRRRFPPFHSVGTSSSRSCPTASRFCCSTR